MLYRGSEVMREVGWVIFDEIHYMRDKGAAPNPLSNVVVLTGNRERCCMGRDNNSSP
jgi:ATP-dependent RNA helicase DOB1